MAASSHLTEDFFENIGISKKEFDEMFEYVDNRIFRLRKGKSLPFTHAVSTTGDRARNLVSGNRGTAGELWRAATGRSIKDFLCCVLNCTNPACDPDDPKNAGATAHVYATFQLSHHDIRFMILLPTCSKCNNWQVCRNTGTNYPVTGQEANVLTTKDEILLLFVEASDSTVGGKGGQGRGTGDGGTFRDANGKGGDKGSHYEEEGKERVFLIGSVEGESGESAKRKRGPRFNC